MWREYAIPNGWGDRIGAIAEIVSGDDVICATNDSWKSGLLPILKSGIYWGEDHDARLDRMEEKDGHVSRWHECVRAQAPHRKLPQMRRKSACPYWFIAPAAIIFMVLFIVPTIASFYFSMTYWDPFEARWAGWDNYVQFFSEPFLVRGVANTLIFAVVTSGLKTVLDLLLAVLLTSVIFGQSFLRSVVFFPVLVSTIGVGILFKELMHPTDGAINMALAAIGIDGPGCLTRSGR